MLSAGSSRSVRAYDFLEARYCRVSRLSTRTLLALPIVFVGPGTMGKNSQPSKHRTWTKNVRAMAPF